jgi:DEAD/DEAH box helicase domain-containing protein
MYFLTEQDTVPLQQQALFFLLQCLPASSLADPAVKSSLIENLSGLPASFTDQAPDPAVIAGSVELNDDKGVATITLSLLAGSELLKTFDLGKALVYVCYNLKMGNEENARYQWQRFWAVVNFLQFLPLMYAWTPDSLNSGIAAGMLWPENQLPIPEQAKDSSTPAWFGLLEDQLAEELRTNDVNWPATPVVGDDVLDANEEVIGLAELIFEEQKIAFLLDAQLAIKPQLEADGWAVFTTVETLVTAINELDSGA